MATSIGKAPAGTSARALKRRDWWKQRCDAEAEEEEAVEETWDESADLAGDELVAEPMIKKQKSKPFNEAAKKEQLGAKLAGHEGSKKGTNLKKSERAVGKRSADCVKQPTAAKKGRSDDNVEGCPTVTPDASAVGDKSTPPAKPKHEKAYVVFVGNLPFDVTKEQLEEHFSVAGGIKTIRIPTSKETGKQRGFAYIEFFDNRSHRLGLGLHHTELGKRQISVEFTSAGGRCEKRLEHLRQKNKALERFKRLPWS